MSADELGGGSSTRLGQEFRVNAIVGFNYRIIKKLGSGTSTGFIMANCNTCLLSFRLLWRHLHGRECGRWAEDADGYQVGANLRQECPALQRAQVLPTDWRKRRLSKRFLVWTMGQVQCPCDGEIYKRKSQNKTKLFSSTLGLVGQESWRRLWRRLWAQVFSQNDYSANYSASGSFWVLTQQKACSV